jgi:hypothetical protein
MRLGLLMIAAAGVALASAPSLAAAQAVTAAAPPPEVALATPGDGDLAAAEADLSLAVESLTALFNTQTTHLQTEVALRTADMGALVEASETHARAAEIDARRYELARADIDTITRSARETSLAGSEAAAEARRIVAELKPQIDEIKREAIHLKAECKLTPDKCVIIDEQR